MHCEMIRELSKRLGENVPEPFYRGFPESVRNLSTDELLLDQLLHYFHTYGLGNFDEQDILYLKERLNVRLFRENTDVQEFMIQTETEAEDTIRTIVKQLLSGSRPLSERQYALVHAFVCDDVCDLPDVASKNTLIRLLIDTKKLTRQTG